MADTSAGGHPKLSFAAAARAVATSTNKEKFERLAPIRSDESDPNSAPTAARQPPTAGCDPPNSVLP
jgi:hypothetical protein